MSQNDEGALHNDSKYHFTYVSPETPDIKQGDIVSKDEGITGLLANVHPHYLHEDYTHFIVLTQSCDMVRRDGNKCNCRYITLAAVRPFSLLLKRQIDSYRNEFTRKAEVCSTKSRQELVRFLSRLFNNNESEYFYLHEDANFGFNERSCAFLRLSISIRAYEHYELCLAARILSLNETFRAKLGWQVGNMYSRVGTDDWVPKHFTKPVFQKQIDDALDECCPFYDEAIIKAVEMAVNRGDSIFSRDELRSQLANTKPQNKRDKVLDSVIKVLRNSNVISDDKQAEKLRLLLNNDPEIAQALPIK